MFRKSLALAIILVACTVSAALAADYFFPRFIPYKDDKPLGAPACQLAGPASLAYDSDEHVTLLAYTCIDGRVILRTDLRPGSGTAVGNTNPAIKLHLDSPAGDTPHGTIVAGGWAYECGHRITEASLLVNGSTVYQAALGQLGQRDDVAAAFGSCASQSGITFVVDSTSWPNGTVTAQLVATDDQGNVNRSNVQTVAMLPMMTMGMR